MLMDHTKLLASVKLPTNGKLLATADIFEDTNPFPAVGHWVNVEYLEWVKLMADLTELII